MKVQLIATAPTVYQSQSLRAFKLDYNPSNNFPKTETKQFETIEDARKYIKELAADYYEGDKRGYAMNVGKNWLRLDAVMAQIEPINKED